MCCAAARSLGGEQRDVGAAQQFLAGAAVVRVQGDADAGTEPLLDTAQGERPAERSDRQPGHRRRRGRVGTRQQQDELVAARPRHQGARGRTGLQPAAGSAQQLVAGLVAERVVDVLEVVEIERQHGQRSVVGKSVERLLDALVQPVAVGQAGQAVVRGSVHQFLLARAGCHRHGQPVAHLARRLQGRVVRCFGQAQHDQRLRLAFVPQWEQRDRRHARRISRAQPARQGLPRRCGRLRGVQQLIAEQAGESHQRLAIEFELLAADEQRIGRAARQPAAMQRRCTFAPVHRSAGPRVT